MSWFKRLWPVRRTELHMISVLAKCSGNAMYIRCSCGWHVSPIDADLALKYYDQHVIRVTQGSEAMR